MSAKRIPIAIARARRPGFPRVTGKIKRDAAACREEARFAKAHTRRPVKVAVAGPMTVIDNTPRRILRR